MVGSGVGPRGTPWGHRSTVGDLSVAGSDSDEHCCVVVLQAGMVEAQLRCELLMLGVPAVLEELGVPAVLVVVRPVPYGQSAGR